MEHRPEQGLSLNGVFSADVLRNQKLNGRTWSAGRFICGLSPRDSCPKVLQTLHSR